MERKLTITGKGNLAIAPDILLLSFKAEKHEWEYEAAIKALNRKVENLRSLVEKEGIDRKSLKTKDFNVRKSTTYNKKTEKHEFNGFSASHNLELELPLQQDLINRLLVQIAKHLKDLDFNIAFGVKDTGAHQEKLLRQAINKAKENAATIADATGVQLMEILDIDYSFRELVIRSQRYDYPIYESSNFLADAEPSLDFEPDDINVAETVTISWRIA